MLKNGEMSAGSIRKQGDYRAYFAGILDFKLKTLTRMGKCMHREDTLNTGKADFNI
jgi:hypothetical protein